MANRWGNRLFLGSKITADGDCSHEIKRHLLLGRKAMTNLDSELKSTDLTLPTKVHLVKAMVFLVVLYGCECWTIKKAEHQRTDAFEQWYLGILLRVLWTVRRSNQSVLKKWILNIRIDWFDLPAVQGTVMSLSQHHSLKASVLWCSAFFMAQLSHPYMTTGKTIALTRWTFVGKVMTIIQMLIGNMNWS